MLSLFTLNAHVYLHNAYIDQNTKNYVYRVFFTWFMCDSVQLAWEAAYENMEIVIKIKKLNVLK